MFISWTLPPLVKDLYLPTSMISMSDASFLIFSQISRVKIVLLLLKMDVSDDINPLSITASMTPRAPATTA